MSYENENLQVPALSAEPLYVHFNFFYVDVYGSNCKYVKILWVQWKFFHLDGSERTNLFFVSSAHEESYDKEL